jgi:hypothetical protein
MVEVGRRFLVKLFIFEEVHKIQYSDHIVSCKQFYLNFLFINFVIFKKNTNIKMYNSDFLKDTICFKIILWSSKIYICFSN